MYRILIIEDDRTIANVLAEHLKTWDYEVHCVTNFKNVMEDFREYEPQLVLLDIVLPLFNGFHWCQEIRKISKVPIIFLSSANDNMNIVMAMNMGGDDFLAKPIDLDVMMAKRKIALGDLADRIGITPANLSILKTGKAKAIRFSTLEAICKELDCQPADILEFKEDET